MRKLIVLGMFSCGLCAFTATPSLAWGPLDWLFHGCESCSKSTMTITLRPYNAFTPICSGNFTCNGCSPCATPCPAPAPMMVMPIMPMYMPSFACAPSCAPSCGYGAAPAFMPPPHHGPMFHHGPMPHHGPMFHHGPPPASMGMGCCADAGCLPSPTALTSYPPRPPSSAPPGPYHRYAPPPPVTYPNPWPPNRAPMPPAAYQTSPTAQPGVMPAAYQQPYYPTHSFYTPQYMQSMAPTSQGPVYWNGGR